MRPVRDNTMYECLAENGVGDAVSAEAQLRVYEGTYLSPSPFLFSTLTIIRAKLVDSEGLETARDPIPHGSIRRYRHYRGGDGGGNLIFNERVAGTGGDTHDRPKVSTTSLLDARGTRGRKFVAGGRKKMIEIAREGCVTSQIPSKLNRVFLPSQLGPPARSTFSFYLYGRANSLMAPSSATRRKAT